MSVRRGLIEIQVRKRVNVVRAAYVPLREYAGETFFNGWGFRQLLRQYNLGCVGRSFSLPPLRHQYGKGGSVSGNVTYVDRNAAIGRRLTHINDAGNAVLKTDNATILENTPICSQRLSECLTRSYPCSCLIGAVFRGLTHFLLTRSASHQGILSYKIRSIRSEA